MGEILIPIFVFFGLVVVPILVEYVLLPWKEAASLLKRLHNDHRNLEVDGFSRKAEEAARAGKHQESLRLFEKAAQIQTLLAIVYLECPKGVRSDLALSAVSLWLKAECWLVVECEARYFLAENLLPEHKRKISEMRQKAREFSAVPSVTFVSK